MRRAAPLLFIAFILLSASTAQAWSFGPLTNSFAQTQSGNVVWKTNATIETNSLVVKNMSLVLGSYDLNITPDTNMQIVVTIEQWHRDRKEFNITMTTGTNTGLNITMTNPGFYLTGFLDDTNISSCDFISPCTWTFANQTSHNIKLYTPTGASGTNLGGTPKPPTPPAAGGGGGGGGSSPPVITTIPNPIELFPTFSAMQWTGVGGGTTLVLSATRYARYLPAWARLPVAPHIRLSIGIVTLLLVYLNATQ